MVFTQTGDNYKRALQSIFWFYLSSIQFQTLFNNQFKPNTLQFSSPPPFTSPTWRFPPFCLPLWLPDSSPLLLRQTVVSPYNSVYLTLGFIADFVFQGATDLQQPAAPADGHLAQRDAQHPPKDDHDHHKDPKDPKNHHKDPKDHPKRGEATSSDDEHHKDPKDHHKDPKDHHKDPKDPKDHPKRGEAAASDDEHHKDPKDHHKDPKDHHHKDPKDPKDHPKRGEAAASDDEHHKDPKDHHKDPKDHHKDPKDHKGPQPPKAN